ncbi:PREDICTED: rRNA 2'-O-methyltransferase fibrillarin-like [Ipomoea nil]|uniref:rRNA 2'-O-methyltransferase fibrillarin-like n=1 Tax=Ipomoea nil TaxID=35883 RepID=UPI00090199FE|nr:PREDICTED: rRNA 2'-O-methyltransferase fibrillarin-like [Ipomoea nil]
MAKKAANPYDPTALHASADDQSARNYGENRGGRGGRNNGFVSRGGNSNRGGSSGSRGSHSTNRGDRRGGRQSPGRGRGNRGGRQTQYQPHNTFWQNAN